MNVDGLVPARLRAVRELGRSNGLRVDATENADAFTPADLAATGPSSSSRRPTTS